MCLEMEVEMALGLEVLAVVQSLNGAVGHLFDGESLRGGLRGPNSMRSPVVASR